MLLSVGRRGWADIELPTLPVLPWRDLTCLGGDSSTWVI